MNFRFGKGMYVSTNKKEDRMIYTEQERFEGMEMNYEKMSAKELLELILAVAYNYDGYRKPESLMGLIDEIVVYTKLAMKALKEDK